jgi:hypothetical protein
VLKCFVPGGAFVLGAWCLGAWVLWCFGAECLVLGLNTPSGPLADRATQCDLKDELGVNHLKHSKLKTQNSTNVTRTTDSPTDSVVLRS